MTRAHKTLEVLVERAERTKKEASNGKWEVEVLRREDNNIPHLVHKTYNFRHWGSLVLRLHELVDTTSGYDKVVHSATLVYYYGESKSDADGLNAMCAYFGLPDRFTFKPVNGGFMKLGEQL